MQLSELLDVIFRWAHLIAGIMWVGNSMLFNWIDRNLEKTAELGKLSQGKIFMLHSGAFYELEKKLLAPGEMPKLVHWFKWQNFTTWATGISLLVTVYYFHGAAFLVDPSVHDVGPEIAICLSVGSLLTGWLIYDALWRTVGISHPRVASALCVIFLFGSIYGFSLVFSGRAAYIETGVLIGTIMTGNVWFVIVPSQKLLVEATISGKDQDPRLSLQAKARSLHNNYLTFPLLFIMISNHVPAATTHHLNWLILIVVSIGGAGVRLAMNSRYLGGGAQRSTKAWLLPAFVSGCIGILGLMVISRLDPRPKFGIDHPVAFARVQEIVGVRCVPCHAQKPSDDVFHSAPGGMMLETPEQIKTMAPLIKYRAYDLANMPFNNKTHITEMERAELAAWVAAGAHVE